MYQKVCKQVIRYVLIQSKFLKPYCHVLNYKVCVKNAFYNRTYLESARIQFQSSKLNSYLQQKFETVEECDELHTIEHLLFRCIYIIPVM